MKVSLFEISYNFFTIFQFLWDVPFIYPTFLSVKKLVTSIFQSSVWVIWIYTTGLNCWMLESDWLTNVEMHGEHSSRHPITCPYYFAKWFALFQRSLLPKTAKEPKPTTTLAKQINIVNKRIKTTDQIHVFARKLFHYVWKAHTLSLPLPLPHRQFAHTLTYILMLLALLWGFYQ